MFFLAQEQPPLVEQLDDRRIGFFEEPAGHGFDGRQEIAIVAYAVNDGQADIADRA